MMYAIVMWKKELLKNVKQNKNGINRIAEDKNGHAIFYNSMVMYRGNKCKVFWDENLLSFYLVPENGYVLHGIPFTTYVAKECEVIR